jgi:hypothetical protein
VTILIGTQFYPADPDSERRQAQAMDALGRLEGVDVVDLQWEPTPQWRPWIRTVCNLRDDSRAVSGCPGRRKPTMSDIFRALGEIAEERGYQYFMFVNADIVVMPAALDVVRAHKKEVYAFSRLDFEKDTGRDLDVTLSGLDAFAFDVTWWRAHRHRFREYIIGDGCWDVVYGAVAMCHADGMLVTGGEIRHERHPMAFGFDAFADFNGYLAAVDSRYFSIWCDYYDALMAARARGASPAEELELGRRMFVWRRSPSAALWQMGRTVKARINYARKRARWNRAKAS